MRFILILLVLTSFIFACDDGDCHCGNTGDPSRDRERERENNGEKCRREDPYKDWRRGK